MELNAKTKLVIIELICLLYVLLFVYAAVSKLLDFENFQIQLGQSPLLNPFAGEISWFVPGIEILIAVLVCIPRLRIVGLFASFALMVLFTAYIYFILNYSSFVPCSCGGILEKLDWKEHFVFNSVFVVLAVVAILLLFKTEGLSKKRTISIFLGLLILAGLGVGTIQVLLNISEDKLFKRNNFIRFFPPVAVKKENIFDLKYNSYYLAGGDQKSVYLGNTTALSLVLKLDNALKNSNKYYIALKDSNLHFNAATLRVSDGCFYLIDGSVPSILKGKTSTWKADLKLNNKYYFSIAEPIDSSSVVFRTLDAKKNENILGTLSFHDNSNPKIVYHPELLQKQIDGVFDTDGAMLYSSYLKKFVYVYYYRNQFIVTDNKLNLSYRGKTIDTISKAKLKVVWMKNKNVKKLAAPALTVNRSAALYRNLLFINSGLPGKYEPLVMWKDASIIDVYDIESKLYLMSFYVYHENGKHLRSFRVTEDRLYGLVGSSIVSYRLGTTLKNYLKKNTVK